ncbi:MAG: segregation/condensation protein A [Phycisphaerae bacterium]|nr:segregation/condensation protein A [Phycisphaerae bacterium]
MAEYRVNLEMYNGPLDLLLYLIRRDEVDIHDIPIVSITEQYLAYVDMLQALDPNLAGEFLVMAATLIEIKSRVLLPASEVPEGEDDGFDIDPRADLVRQLLQYKAFKDAAGDLKAAGELQALKFVRNPGRIHLGDEKDVDLEEVQIWDLFDAFRNVMDAIGKRPQNHEVIYDDTPVELHAEDILDRLHRDGTMSFEKIFEGREQRSEVIGLFLAVLELIRLQKIFVVQGANFGQIDVHLNPNPPAERDVEHLFARATVPDEEREKTDEEPEAEGALPPFLPDRDNEEDDLFDEEGNLSLEGLLADDLADIDLNTPADELGTYESEADHDDMEPTQGDHDEDDSVNL